MPEALAAEVDNQFVPLAVAAFFRYRRLFLSVLVFVMLLVVAVTLASKRQYRSEAKFIFENNRSMAIIAADRSSSPTGVAITDQQLSSELEIMTSDDVVGAVADPGWSTLGAKLQNSPTALRAHEERLSSFRKHLSVEPARKSNVIVVGFTASSPAKAKEILEQYSSAYLSQRKTLSRPAGTSHFYAEQAQLYQDAWKRADQALVQFQQQHQLVTVEQTENGLEKQILGYEDDLRSNRASLAEMSARLVASRQAVKGLPSRQETQTHTIVNETSTEQMRTLLVQLQNRRTELLTRYTSQDPLVKEINREIEETKMSLAEAMVQKGHEDTTDVNPAWQQVQNTLAEQGIERQALTRKNDAIALSLDALRTRLAEMQALDVTFRTLQANADEARSNADLFSEKRDQAEVEDAMDEHKFVNVALAETATSSYRPVSPKPLLNLVLGFATALFLATTVLYFAETGRTTIASPRELELYSSFPVLATFPNNQASAQGQPHSQDSVN